MLKRYVIALASLHDMTNTVSIVHAESELDALQHFLQLFHIDSIEEILELCAENGILVSLPQRL